MDPPGFWTEKSNEGYKKLSVCIEKQYWSFTAHQLPEGLQINGTRTLDENLADIGGARLAYFGYRKYIAHMIVVLPKTSNEDMNF